MVYWVSFDVFISEMSKIQDKVGGERYGNSGVLISFSAQLPTVISSPPSKSAGIFTIRIGKEGGRKYGLAFDLFIFLYNLRA